MTLSIKKKTLRKVVSSLTMLATVVSMSGMMALSSVSIASAAVVDGSLIKSNATNSDGTPTIASLDVYIVKLVGTKKFKRLMLNPTVFESYGHLNWGDIQTVSQAVMDEYTTSALVRVDTDPAEKVFAMAPDGDIGSKSWVNLTTAQFVTEAGSDADSIYTINAVDGGNYTAVGDVTTVAELTTFYTTGALPGVVPVPAQALTVALSANTAVSGTIVGGQAVANLATFNFTAGSDGAAKITTLKVKRTGVSADTTLTNVYLYEGSTRLTDNASVSAGYISWNNSAGIFTVPAGTTKSVTVKSDIAVAAGETVGVQIVAATDVTTDGAAVSGSFPISGNIMSVASATLANVDLAIAMTPATAEVDPQNDYTVWANTVNFQTRAVDLESLTFSQIGSAQQGDLTNFRLYVSGSQVGEAVAEVDLNGYVIFDLTASPERIESGSREVKVIADIVNGSSRTFVMSLRRAADAVIVDSQYGANVLIRGNASLTTGSYATHDSGTMTIASGAITITKATDSPSGNVVNNGSQVVLAKYQLKATGEAMKVENLRINYTSSDATIQELRNGALFYNGVQVGSTTDIMEDSYSTTYTEYSLGSSVIVVPGTPGILEVKADIYDGEGTTNHVSATDTILVNVVAGSSNVKRQVSQTYVANTAQAANTLTVAEGSLVLSKNQSYGNQTTVVPQTTYKMAEFTLNSGTTENVNLNTLTVDFTTGGGDFTVADLSNVYLVYGTTTSSSKATVSATVLTNTWSINKAMTKNTSMTIAVYADIAVGAYVTATDTMTTSLRVAGTTANSGTAVNTNSNAVLAGQVITSANAGTLTVSLDNGTPLVAQVVAGSNPDDGSLKIKLTATNEDVYVKTLTVRVNTNANDAAVSTLTLNGKEGSGSYVAAGSQATQNLIIDGANPGYVTWTLSGADRVKVAKNGSSYLLIKPTYVSSGQGSVSSLTPKLFLAELEAEGAANLVAGFSTATNNSGIVVQANSSGLYVDSTETDTAADTTAVATTIVTANGQIFLPGDVIFIDEDAGNDFDVATEELMIVLADSGPNLTVSRGAFGTTARAYAVDTMAIFRLSTATMTTSAGIVGNAMTVLDTKLSLAVASDSPATNVATGEAGKIIFTFNATAENNNSDPAENKATLTHVDITTTESAATVTNMVVYPSTFDQNATYVTTCGALSATKWRCTMSSTGGTNEVIEGTTTKYVVRGDVGYNANGSVTVKIATLGSSSTSTNDVYWTDGTTPQYWVNQSSSSVQGGAQSTTVASGTADATAPTISSVVIANGTTGTALIVDATDTITITFSEMVDPSIINASLIPGSSVTGVAQTSTGGLLCTAATPANTCTVKGIVSFVDTYATSSQAVATSTSTLALNSAGTVLTITLTAAAANTNVGAQTISATTAIVGTTTAGIRDISTNVMAAGALATQAIGGF
ncbi:MAG: Ig-like domain-containing protein [Patescibacteria group bacterium]